MSAGAKEIASAATLADDPVSNVLKRILLSVGVLPFVPSSFGAFSGASLRYSRGRRGPIRGNPSYQPTTR